MTEPYGSSQPVSAPFSLFCLSRVYVAIKAISCLEKNFLSVFLWHIRGGLFSILSNATCYRKAKSRSQEEPASRAALSICGDVYLMLRSFNLSSTNLPCSNRFTLPLFPSLMLVALELLFPPFRLRCLNLYTSCLGRLLTMDHCMIPHTGEMTSKELPCPTQSTLVARPKLEMLNS